MAAYFGSLSISSLDSDGQSEMSESRSQVELYQRLQDLEDITANYLNDRPILLSEDHGTFAEVEREQSVEFELRITSIDTHQVLGLVVSCLPDCLNEENSNIMLETPVPIVEHHALSITMKKLVNSHNSSIAASQTVFRPKLHNGEYSFVLTSAHGLSPGSYLITITNTERSKGNKLRQYVRLSHKFYRSIRATPIDAGVAVVGKVQCDEFVFYRFVNKDAGAVIRISIKPVLDEFDNPKGDADLYVSNKYDALVGVSRDDFVWKSTQVGADRIDIHPDDVNVKRGDFFIIGVNGYRDSNEFILEVNYCSPFTMRTLSINESVNVPLRKDSVSYFSLKFDPSKSEKILLNISGNDSKAVQFVSPENNAQELSKLEHEYGRGVYATDTLASNGLFLLPDCKGQFPPVLNTSVLNAKDELNESTVSNESGNLNQSRANLRLSANNYDISFYSQSSQSPVSLKGSPMQRSPLHRSHFDEEVELIGGDSEEDEEETLKVGGAFRDRRQKKPHNIKKSHSGDNHLPVVKDIHGVIPSSSCLEASLFPVVYMSTTCMYPDSSTYTWRSSGATGIATILIETEELKYSSGVCYFSVHALDISSTLNEWRRVNYKVPPAVTDSAKLEALRLKMQCTISVRSIVETSNLTSRALARHAVFERIYRDIDGNTASHVDRSNLAHAEESSFTYGEVDYFSFQSLLSECGAKDGQIFYDLGSGAGKALLSAMFSDIRFLRCTGIELFPSLCKCAEKAIQRAQSSILSNSAEYHFPIPSHHSATSSSSMFHHPPAAVAEKEHERSHFVQTVEEYRAMSLLQSGMTLVDVRHANILEDDWSDGDLVYVSSLCFADILLQGIFLRAQKLKPGSILLTSKVPEGFENSFSVVKSVWCKVSWGRTKIFVLIRKDDDEK